MPSSRSLLPSPFPSRCELAGPVLETPLVAISSLRAELPLSMRQPDHWHIFRGQMIVQSREGQVAVIRMT